ncbi:MAG: ribosomal protein S18-alanine N-acetyltransferase [Alphaproteobacteria bacterium]|nr:ribosomal protein S18-alanine N-acetyltransferase [Alphaproteobacteria bacterium]
MPKLEIRKTDLSMAQILVELHAACFDDEAWTLDQMRGSLELPTTCGWAAYTYARAIGLLLCQMTEKEAEILTLGVYPEAQRRGIGQRLLEEATDAIRNTGAGAIFLEVAADNLAARRLYEKLGFCVIGSRPAYYRRVGGPENALCYRKILLPLPLHKGT